MKSLLLFLSLLASHPSLASESFSPFSALLDGYVREHKISDGGYETAFDYEAAKAAPKTQGFLDQQTSILKSFDLTTLNSEKKANAFWINTYNFFMLKKILTDGFKGDQLKVEGVKSFGSFFSPYKAFQKKEHNVSGIKMSLDQIEKETLLGKEFKKKGWKDARIHFAVNCASVGCPPLLNKIYTAKDLDQILNDNIRRALRTPRHFKNSNGKIYLTHLFKWYKKDFAEAQGSVKKFLIKHLENRKDKKAVESSKGFSYIEYDWNLNKPSNFKK